MFVPMLTPILKNHLETRLDEVQSSTVTSLLVEESKRLKRGRSKSER